MNRRSSTGPVDGPLIPALRPARTQEIDMTDKSAGTDSVPKKLPGGRFWLQVGLGIFLGLMAVGFVVELSSEEPAGIEAK